MRKVTQNQKVLNYLESNTGLSEDRAFARMRVRNLSAVVSNLRQRGFAIESYRNHLGGTSYRFF